MSKVESAKQYLKEADRLYKDIALTKNENVDLRAKLDIAVKALEEIRNQTITDIGGSYRTMAAKIAREALAQIQVGSPEVKK